MVRILYQAIGIVLLPLLFATTVAAQDDIYVYQNDTGSLHFSDEKSHDGFRYYGKKKKAKQPTYSRSVLRSATIEQKIAFIAKRYNVDPALVWAIVKQESNFNPKAVSHKGAMGLMQLMPKTAKYLQVQDPFNPEQNIRGGVSYFASLLKQYDGNVKLALAGYNAGPGAVNKYNGVPPYPETVHYIKQVLRYYRQLKAVS